MFEQTCAELTRAAIDRDDERAFGRLLRQVHQAATVIPVAELTAGVRLLAQGVAEAPLDYAASLAVMSGMIVENGADADAPGTAVMGRLLEVTTGALTFADAWAKAAGGEPPDPAEHQPSREVWDVVRPGLGDGAGPAMEAWWSLPRFALAASTVLSVSPMVRASVPDRETLAAAVDRAEDHCGQLTYVRDLLRVLDGERLLVLDRASGRGWTVVIGGIGDNFQLHTLLAGELIRPDRLPGQAPDPRWVGSSLDQDVPPGTPAVTGQWNLVDVDGEWIWNEGVPADIPEVGGTRVVVLDPPPYERSWNPGRRFPQMPASLFVEAAHDPASLQGWWQRVRPATTRPTG
ncbi:hypothetical protein [Actinoallomurus iriomotensis]|uniref:Uncharacterized protein n=1 Tax=Actinoallomurus iriomotensis TaxID=478107 RepID=A0A9W6VWU5_9ACTN|nr:hypothetical protein [Actinoallomurus iriomotensis]GLY81141.1 hypothetical protein Airi01_094080 [Actinoallomurus iriomotensis]